MATTVVYPDVELFLAGWLRTRLLGVHVSNRHPRPEDPARETVVVRDDSGPDEQFTAARTVGITTVGLDGQQLETSELARTVAALLRTLPEDLEDATNPVVRVDRIRGPYRVITEGTRPEMYLTADLVIVGAPFDAA